MKMSRLATTDVSIVKPTRANIRGNMAASCTHDPEEMRSHGGAISPGHCTSGPSSIEI